MAIRRFLTQRERNDAAVSILGLHQRLILTKAGSNSRRSRLSTAWGQVTTFQSKNFAGKKWRLQKWNSFQLFRMKPHLRAKIDHQNPHRGSHCRHSASSATSENNNLKLSWGKSQIKEILDGQPGYKNAVLLLEIVFTNQKLLTLYMLKAPYHFSTTSLGE